FDRLPDGPGQQLEEAFDTRRVELHVRRQLPAHGAEALAEGGDGVEEELHRLLDLLQALDVGYGLVPLHGEDVIAGRFRRPGLEARRLLILVEGRVDLDRRHMPAGPVQLFLLLEALRIELAVAPLRKHPAGHAGSDPACHCPSSARVQRSAAPASHSSICEARKQEPSLSRSRPFAGRYAAVVGVRSTAAVTPSLCIRPRALSGACSLSVLSKKTKTSRGCPSSRGGTTNSPSVIFAPEDQALIRAAQRSSSSSE